MSQIPDRPTLTQEMKLQAAQALVTELGWLAHNADDIASQYRMHMDGYELAKELERWCSWDVSRDEMEDLDGMDSHVRKLLKAAEKEWFEGNDIQPPLPIGSRVNTHEGTGHITGVCEHDVATYEVKPEGQDDAANGNRRFLFKFEDIRPA